MSLVWQSASSVPSAPLPKGGWHGKVVTGGFFSRTPSPQKIKKGETIMTFSDIFKSSFLENVTSVSVLDMVLALGLTVAFLYRKKG